MVSILQGVYVSSEIVNCMSIALSLSVMVLVAFLVNFLTGCRKRTHRTARRLQNLRHLV